jgi:hypothetical protein
MEEYKKPKPRGVAFGITVDVDGKFQLVKLRLNGKSSHTFETLKDDLTRYDLKAQFNRAIGEFFHDFETSKLH